MCSVFLSKSTLREGFVFQVKLFYIFFAKHKYSDVQASSIQSVVQKIVNTV